ncbi:MAG: TonB-dependent receptor plug domain-containing protein [Alistipes sp.]|nr:TonB-dependent receptor plug domain-containing protein [Alistipes senegalensis]MCM1249886.1 TonB-dependent receptor plug domain-containing protein [Alistipes sp.]
MFDLFLYSLKAGACLAVFYLFFKWLLSRETLHRFNRIVVLAGMVLAFLLPLCVVTVYRELPSLPEVRIAEPADLPLVSETASPAFDWERLLGGLFVAGAVAMLAWTGRSFVGMFRVIRSGRRERLDGGAVLVRVPQAVTPFSWGRYIVVSEEDLATAGREIVLHEQAHLRLHHSVDLLLTDLAGCFQWFNPAMWLLRRELRAIHEYEADRAVIASGVEARDYQLLLIRKAVGGRWYSVANSFNHSKLKNRITMMLRKESSRWAGVKALFVLPLSAVAVGAFARTAYVVPDDKVTKESVTVAISEPNISLRRLNSEPPAQPDDSIRLEDTVVVSYGGDSKSPAPALLYIVDGQEVASLDDLDPGRIASIDVYKDAATYGKKAENGVIVITTKSAARTAGKAKSIRFPADRKFTIEGRAASLSDKNILYMVDGIPVDGIDDLKSEEIASITVVKDRVPEKYREQGYESMVVVITKNSSVGRDETEAYFNSDEWKSVQKKLEKVDKYFRSDEWKAKQKQFTDVGEYFESDEWKQAQQQIADAAEQAAAAGSSLNGQVVSIRADRYTEKPESSGVTHSTGRITLSGTEGIPDDCLIFINGRRVSKADLEGIPAGKIRRMSIYKGQQAVDKFGPEAVGGAIDIKAKGFKNK